MRAVLFDRHGDPEVLRLADVPLPEPGAAQVRVRVRAVGVQPFDVMVRRGNLENLPIRVHFPQRLGNEFSGTIDAVGSEVDGWEVGDAVLGWAFMQTLADQVVAETDAVVAKPAGMPWEVAGGLSSSGQTAWYALQQLRVQHGDTVLIHAAAGGVGSMAVQLAREWGARVIGTASPENHGYLEDLGARPVTYGSGLVDRVRAIAPQGVDAVLDAIGGSALSDSLALGPAPQRIVTLVDHRQAMDLGVVGIRTKLSAHQLRGLVEMHERGALRMHVRAVYPLERVADAHRDVEHGHGRGKVVVQVRRDD